MYFDEAYKRTMGHEGGYVNDPDDPGGETYKGISRRYHPNWTGWFIIDSLKDNPAFPEALAMDLGLQADVKAYYKERFWDRFLGDEFTNKEIAYELFDNAVNLGVTRAVEFLQRALNAFNRNQLLYPDLVVDGQFGQKTLDALTLYLRNDYFDNLLTAINCLQGAYYLEKMRESPIKEKYARGWFTRVSLAKEGV